jgi:simple sugar transport system ATP-binding protein
MINLIIAAASRALADRIAVMYRGRIVGIVSADATRETLGKMMAGIAA